MKVTSRQALVGLVVAVLAGLLGWWMGSSAADAPGGGSATDTVVSSKTEGGLAVIGDVDLPAEQRGYHREYTVETPGDDDRGPRRIVTGSEDEIYYTDDHVAAFAKVRR